MEQGMIHVYQGDGKGKTTASVGLAVRAAGNKKRVIFAQFLKGNPTGEIEVLKQLSNVAVIRNEKDMGFVSRMSKEEKEEVARLHNQTLEKIQKLLSEEKVDLLVLDELTYPYAWNLIDKKKVEELILQKPETLELVITGRNPDRFFLEHADYITNMQCERHPYQKGIRAREGVEY